MKISILRPKRSSGNTTYGIKLGAVGLLALISASTYAFDYSKLPPPVSETDFPVHSNEKVALGKMLFYDKILSGNRNISCATCHHGHIFMGDGLSLPVGEGGQGLGVTRNTGALADQIYERVPRNAPHIFNLGTFEFTRMFHDGRVETDAKQPSRFRTPAGDDFPEGLDNALAAQAMFPVTSITEMAGQEGENSIADVAKQEDVLSIWNQLAERLQSVDEYVDLFKAAYPNEI
ncbi:MAG: cytochrome-c peroxidase, partial [Methylococcales bacterium]